MIHKVTVRHPDRTDSSSIGTPYREMWVAVCECGWFTSYFEPTEYSRARFHGDNHEKLHSLPEERRRSVELHAFTTVQSSTGDGRAVTAHGKCGACAWVGPQHLGEGCVEKAAADSSAHFAEEIKKSLAVSPKTK